MEVIGSTVKKRRSHTSRRPRPESRPVSGGRDISSLSSTPPSNDIKEGSSDGNSGGDHNSRRKELSLSQCASKFPVASEPESDKPVRNSKKVDAGLDELYGNSSSMNGNEEGQTGSNQKRSSEGLLAPVNWKNTSRLKESSEPFKTMAFNSTKSDENSFFLCNSLIKKRKSDENSGPSLDGSGNESKFKKFKFKVGGVTGTVNANSSTKTSPSSDATVSRQKPLHKDNSDVDKSPPSDKRGGLQGIPWKDFSRGGFSLGRDDSPMGKTSGKNRSGKQGDKADPVRKSRGAPKKRAIHGFDDDDDDDEIRYLEKLRKAKFSAGFGDDDEESCRRQRRLSKFTLSTQNLEGNSSLSGKDGNKRSPSEDSDYVEEDELASDGEPEARKNKKTGKDIVNPPNEPKREMTLTTRQRALQSASAPGTSVVQFPNGLPPAPPRKQKEKLSEVEQQLKKAEAAERRRIQNEKAARESEAEAIRKILGQDSSKKKKEEKRKKREEELTQEKAADERIRASNCIRTVMGPNGTTVTFPIEVGLPSIFNSKPCSYPPPRETCAGPLCTSPYKYRDSKTKLPLCSLQCYKAVKTLSDSEERETQTQRQPQTLPEAEEAASQNQTQPEAEEAASQTQTQLETEGAASETHIQAEARASAATNK